jgi:hypothetical protein
MFGIPVVLGIGHICMASPINVNVIQNLEDYYGILLR